MEANFITEIIDKEYSGLIHTRFPPEPNGYLHIGSAKAIYINWAIAKKYNGKFNLRLDDTNPAREDIEYVNSIIKDLTWLTGEEPDGGIFYGSDYFDKCYDCALALIKKGLAFVCDLPAEQMREYRGTLTAAGTNSPYRDRSIEENLDLFERMKNGEFQNGEKTLRAKIDMTSPNINLRDPAIYRIIHTEHHRQGDKWCIYPLYDFAHPIQDAIEGISHSLCSIEFENHRPLYEWVVNNTNIGTPRQIEFSRLNLTNTVMSKRYLRELVETKLVDGWDDPRMPTLCGLRARGYTSTAILDFIERSGVTRSPSISDIRLLEHCIREELNETALRRIAIINPLKVVITNYDKTEEFFDMPNHPGNKDLGYRPLPFSSEIFIEKEDFALVPPPKFNRLREGGEVRLMGAYIIKCNKVELGASGEPITLYCTADLETSNKMPADGRKVKGTVHWLSSSHCDTGTINLFENLFTIENTGDIPDDKDYKDFLNKNSKKCFENALFEKSIKDTKGRMQFVRTGYFISAGDNSYNQIVTLKETKK